MSDKIQPAPDVRFRPVGMGMHIGFLCPRCNLKKSSTGRKLQRVMGLRTWVCKGCVK